LPTSASTAAGWANRGKWARFDYVDADGKATHRQIVNWEKRGAYIVGYDRSRDAERTFRQDRIEGWVAG
jgi:predicted DNA-binding transcriptional regulator YafY